MESGVCRGIPQLAGNCLEASSNTNCTSFDNGICFLPHQRPPYECGEGRPPPVLTSSPTHADVIPICRHPAVSPLPSDSLDRHVVTTAVILGVVALCVLGACLGGLGASLFLCCRPKRAVLIPLVSVDVRKGGPITGITVIKAEGGPGQSRHSSPPSLPSLSSPPLPRVQRVCRASPLLSWPPPRTTSSRGWGGTRTAACCQGGWRWR